MPVLEEVKIKAENLQAALNGEIISQKYCSSEFQILGNKVDAALKILDQLAPKTRPVDLQTTDAGPSVGILATVVRLRMTESFLLNDLDLQVRAHYAARDSKSHKVEQVMRSLTVRPVGMVASFAYLKQALSETLKMKNCSK